MRNEQNSIDFEGEKTKAILTKILYKESFYGLLGTHPEATESEIENGFQNKAKEINSKEDIALLLKAYSILKSSYKQQYDDYIKNYKIGINKVVESLSGNEKVLKEIFGASTVLSENNLPEGIFLQPWSTSL